MKESSIRLMVYVTGIGIFALVVVHLLSLSSGGLENNVAYGTVIKELSPSPYSVSLLILLGLVLVHSSLGIRRFLRDVGSKKTSVLLTQIFVGIIFLLVLVIGVMTIR
ncbi:succinate dehydrogenase [Metallosphaera tengchongensis]|uniref:Succinate dehydrogenase n=1 Tax=Metallosphaera tengchongensis TaxID=1532350 RepID=A0A6N0NYL3_9CREN|nr:succinate dehydrogenase [Metallosphaera tengchongensis]QKR00190.1 succinate dehydrogenase [Metallosphaera tengchongensis]